ncbi:DUF488 domain-containing protein [Microbacterium luticocti]|uniref:DUF488 domain-containing protein n=1 Tax=Microbacterium luticocti TaxID=451764 RepID=UPI00040E6A0A|nr:DUF488 family protein [Microbacterium luticocti]
MEIRSKRVYDDPDPADGFRVLVDRLWPRGLSKQRAQVDLWDKDVAPSAQLRTAFHHDGMPFSQFEKAYRAELAAGADAVAALRKKLTGHDVVTLLYATHDTEHNHTGLLREALLA